MKVGQSGTVRACEKSDGVRGKHGWGYKYNAKLNGVRLSNWLGKIFAFYFLAFPEIDSIEILKTLVLSLSFSMYFNPSEKKFSEYL